ncbi:hypothetical protein IWX50DRAFT_467376 [Phyllosticta citricarpa]|uniref:Secreted protein n=1 Tax=Phyllosticta citricarpa TaxID=55181 RepID=A0ABR1MHB4_9PEZI
MSKIPLLVASTLIEALRIHAHFGTSQRHGFPFRLPQDRSLPSFMPMPNPLVPFRRSRPGLQVHLSSPSCLCFRSSSISIAIIARPSLPTHVLSWPAVCTALYDLLSVHSITIRHACCTIGYNPPALLLLLDCTASFAPLADSCRYLIDTVVHLQRRKGTKYGLRWHGKLKQS